MKSAILLSLCAIIGTTLAACSVGYVQVGEKCYSVPGLPQRFSWWSSFELCSVARGELFHVVTRQEWDELNVFLVGLGYTDTYWTGVSAEGHPGEWVVRGTGQPLNIDAVEFKQGAPSNTADKLCLAIEYQRDLGRYQWVDLPCSDGAVVVCEYSTCRTGP